MIHATRRRRTLLACSLGLVLPALPAQAAQHAESEATTIRLVSITTKYRVLVDTARKGEPDAGDVVWARSTLRNAVPQFGKPKGAIVGSDVGTFTVVSGSVGDVKVAVTLPGGTLRTAGRIRDNTVQVTRVTGGTGTYAGARGTCEVRPIGASAHKASNVYRLRLP